MGNSYFQFKQFRIEQGKAAMKVCTDACILGAWSAKQAGDAENILDIGAGTGLLMHMLAQQSSGKITGIEIDEEAYVQCLENIYHNPWKERMEIIHGDIKKVQPGEQYDFIISNPPFYENALERNSTSQNLAMHHEGLKLGELLALVPSLLTSTGKFAILLPFERKDELIHKACRKHLYPERLLTLKHSRNHFPFRIIGLFSLQPVEKITEEKIVIRQEDGSYTPEFSALLKPYYLYL